MQRWHEDEGFWLGISQGMFTPERYAQAAGEVDQILKLLDLPAGAAVLDLCCGTGRHAIELARRGFTVTGVDRTGAFLSEAENRAREAGVSLELVRADARTFARPGAFDLALNMFTSFGYFDSADEEQSMLAHLHDSLRSGGRLFMELNGKEVLARNWSSRHWTELPNGTFLLEQRTVRPGWEWIDWRWLLISGGERFERTTSMRAYSAGELRLLLEHAGFRDVRFFGTLDGGPYDESARQMVVTATRG